MATTEERIKVTFSDMAQQGDAFARHDDTLVFAANGIPGEEAIVELRHGRKRYRTGQVVELVKALVEEWVKEQAWEEEFSNKI